MKYLAAHLLEFTKYSLLIVRDRTGAVLAGFATALVFAAVCYALHLGKDDFARETLEWALLIGLGVSCGYNIGRARPDGAANE